MAIKILIYLIGAYLLGSIPSAYCVGRLVRGIDIRQHGSRNVGATNAFRVLGPGIGLGVLFMDILKGFLAVKAGQWAALPEWSSVVAGLVAIAGHNWTCFLSFRGGKGVATSAGVFCALVPYAFLLALAVFILSVALTRYISVGSMSAALVLAVATTIEFFFQVGDAPASWTLAITYVAALLVLIRHRANIERLRQGRENRFSFRRSGAKPSESKDSDRPSSSS